MAPKGSSGRRKSSGGGSKEDRQIKTLQKWAKKGEMPYSVSFGSDVGKYNKAFEAIDRYYAWPSEEYLRASGVDMSSLLSGWEMIEDVKYRTGRAIGLGTYHMRKRISVHPKNGKIGLRYLYSPIDASPEARQGAMKYALYATLKQAKVLDKEQFIMRE